MTTTGSPDLSDAPAPATLVERAHSWVAGLGGLKAGALAGLFGAIANLGYAPVYFWPALALSLCGLVWLVDGAASRKRRGAAVIWRALCFGFMHYLVGLHWIVAAFLVDPGAHLAFVWLPLVALPLGLAAIITAPALRLALHFWSPGPSRVVVFALSMAAFEWVRGHLFGGLPWNLPGMTWAPGGAISQSASIWGVYGLSALTLLAFVAPAALVDNRPRSDHASRALPAILAAILFGAVWGWGMQRLAEQGPVVEATNPQAARVRLVEVGTPQAEKFKDGSAVLMARRFIELTGEDGPSAPDIVIWPEGALPWYLFEWPDALDAISERLGDRLLLIGISRREGKDTPNEKAFNSLAVVNRFSNVSGAVEIYDKHRLVPLGEFVPLRELAALVGIPTLQALAKGGFTAGPSPETIRTTGAPPFGPLICYEGIFPGLSPAGADRPEWLVNVSNDAWFGGLSGPWQHAAQARYRSIEEGLPMARVASGGFSGMIDPLGRWAARAATPGEPDMVGNPEGWTPHVLDAAIPPALKATPYSRWRDAGFALMLAAMVVLAWLLPRR